MADFRHPSMQHGTITLEEYRALEPRLTRPLTLGGIERRHALTTYPAYDLTLDAEDTRTAALDVEDAELFVNDHHHAEEAIAS